ncbi:MAG: putative immunity protein [Patescibacteria group bacterium]
MLSTTLRKLRTPPDAACADRYTLLTTALGGEEAYGLDTPITILQALDICGLDDTLWGLRKCDDNDVEKFTRDLICDYAEHVLSVFEAACPDDMRPREAIEIARKYTTGEATSEELSAARAAAWDAARAAAGTAAGTAAWDAARTAAWAAASAAAGAAAWDAARAAAWAAAGAAERQWQEHRLKEKIKERG